MIDDAIMKLGQSGHLPQAVICQNFQPIFVLKAIRAVI